jgi:Ca2+/H+ antiporter, TMEM165/GDT1 family
MVEVVGSTPIAPTKYKSTRSLTGAFFLHALGSMPSTELLSVTVSSFSLVGLAEIGDKSQLVCMTLAARYRGWPVFWGAIVAFALLNALASAFGAVAVTWLPETLLSLVVATVFALFGFQALRYRPESESGLSEAVPSRRLFISTLMLILIAEFGDKTQIAVVGMSVNWQPLAVWLGATLALVSVTALGILLGKTLLKRLPVAMLHRLGGGMFLIFAVLAVWRAF